MAPSKEKIKEYNRRAYLKRKADIEAFIEPQEIKDSDITYSQYLRLNDTIIKSYEQELSNIDATLLKPIVTLIKRHLYNSYKDADDYEKRRKIIASILMEMKHNGSLIEPNTDEIVEYINAYF
jgi:hypothetical protein